MTVTRRQFTLAGILLSGAAAGSLYAHQNKKHAVDSELILSAADSDNQHYLLLTDMHGRPQLSVSVSQRAHDVAYNAATQYAVFFPRRPGTEMVTIDLGKRHSPKRIKSAPGTHFYGHGVFSADGRWLFTTENEFDTGRGIIAVYDAADQFKRVRVMDCGGIGPHQLAWMNDQRTLVVAIGGILTNPASERDKLNIDTMQPALTYIDSETGNIIDSFRPQHHQMSIRHLAVSSRDQVIIGVQFEGPAWQSVPLVLSHCGETALQPMADNSHWPMLNQYIASVAISADGKQAITTTPRGSLVSRWNLDDLSLINAVGVRDVAGAAYSHHRQQFVVSNGIGQLFSLGEEKPKLVTLANLPAIHWDNHLALIS